MWATTGIACIGLLMTACSYRVWVGVVNNTDETVEVSDRPQHVSIAPGAMGRVHYGRLTIVAGGCRAHYPLPVVVDIPGYDAEAPGTVYLQLQPDGVLYLLPPETRTPVADVSGSKIRVAPTDRRCKRR
jgi:hypothetical protein